jgi:alginate O-acetyltransferase complex protein AlgI
MAVAMVTMALSGLWHGAAFTFLIWGFYHGFLLVMERVLRIFPFSNSIRRLIPDGLFNVAAACFMFTAVALGWIVFRAQHLSILYQFLLGLVQNHGLQTSVLYEKNVWLGMLLCFLIQGLGHFSFRKKEYFIGPFVGNVPARIIFRPAFQLGVTFFLAFVFATAVFLRPGGISAQFIYFQF